MKALQKKEIGTHTDPLLHRNLKRVAAASGRRIDAIIEDAIRQALAAFPTKSLTPFEEMHARYERLHGIKIDVATEAALLSREKRRRATK